MTLILVVWAAGHVTRVSGEKVHRVGKELVGITGGVSSLGPEDRKLTFQKLSCVESYLFGFRVREARHISINRLDLWGLDPTTDCAHRRNFGRVTP